jgi:putative phosphoesterase
VTSGRDRVLLALIADTHLPRRSRALRSACVEQLRAADLILHAGDFTTHEVLDEIRALGPPVHAVHGNVDCARLRRALPAERIVAAGPCRIALVHDAGPARARMRRLRRRFPQTDAVVFGHSHMPLHEAQEGFQIFNPGSPTERRRSAHHAMGLAQVEGRRIRFRHLVLD